ncbi:MAG TPA: succinate dehydrogenase assembly factor 2 [Sphingomicrobium sp.]
MDSDTEIKRLRYRAWHRGIREADLLVGAFFDAHHANWGSRDRAQFEAMLEEQDVDILAWAHGTADVPERYRGPMMQALQKRDYL